MPDLNSTVQKIKKNLLRNGMGFAEVNEAFGVGEPSKLSYLTDLFRTFSYWSNFYKDDELEGLKKFTVPEVVLDFYRNFEPQYLPILNGGVNLLGLEAIKEENASAIPSMYLLKFGLLTMATTIGGNVICIDLNGNSDDPRVVVADYTFCSFNEELNVIECINVSDSIADNYLDNEPIVLTYDLIKECLPQIANSFSQFLRKIAEEEFENIERDYLIND